MTVDTSIAGALTWNDRRNQSADGRHRICRSIEKDKRQAG